MRRVKRIFGVTLLIAVMLLSFSACGKKPGIIRIVDRDIVTEWEAMLPDTVGEILKAAGIELGEGDEVSPSADTKLEEPGEVVISRRNKVKLTIDGETRDVIMVGGKVRDLLAKEGITLGDEQKISVDLDEFLTDGMEIEIKSYAGILITADGKTEEYETEAKTVGEALKELKIAVGEEDILTPAESTEVKSGLEIVIQRVTFEEVTETEEIDYETERVDNGNLAQGTEEVSVAGVKGEKTLTYKVRLVDGEEESRELVKEEVTLEPVTEVIYVGTYVEPEPQQQSTGGDSGGGVSIVKVETFPACNSALPDDSITYYSDHTTMTIIHNPDGSQNVSYGTW